MNYAGLPTLNACFNASSAVFLTAGFAMIRAKRTAAHRACMLAAFAASSLFLVSYLVYHYHAGSKHFSGRGPIRTLYFSILISHSTLAVVNVPLILRALWLAWRERFDEHRRLARWVFPSWMYVSVTGVVVYWMLYRR